MAKVIEVENLSKMYRLGEVGTGTLSHDLNRWWHKVRGLEDPYLKVTQSNDRTKAADSDYVWSLKDINFSVEQGDIVGIIGRNGAGKSTLLKVLSSITSPTTGSIKVKGRIASLLEVGTGFHPEMTGRENIYMNGTIMGMRKHEITSKLEEIVEFAGISKYLDTPVKRYSSGMMVRLGFAIAAHLEPEILIVDEVLAVGDAEFQKKCIGKMQDVSQNQGRTVLFVSHNMGAIQNLCKSTIVLNNGQVAFTGNVRDGVNYYLNANKQKIEHDLSSRTDRKNSGAFKFSNIYIRDKQKNEIDAVCSGQNIEFVLEYLTTSLVENVEIRLIIVDDNDNTVFVCNNYHSSSLFASVSENQKIVCSVNQFPLPQGIYYVHLRCMSNRQVLDEVDFAYEISVEQGDFYGTGKTPVIKSAVYVSHEYYLENGK